LAWGWWLRALHGFSGFCLLALTAAHTVELLLSRSERNLPSGLWWRSVLLGPLAVLALLGGFVLRGDAEAVAAGSVWRGVTSSVPGVGPTLAVLLLGTAFGDTGTILLHHAGTFTLLLWLLTAEHAGHSWPDLRSTVLAGLVSFALAGLVPLPLGPPSPGDGLLLGPWYLLGLQGALVSLPRAAGWAAPLALVLAVGLVRHSEGRTRSALVVFIGLWLAAYAVFTARVLLLSRGS
jgi:ubiquinol-cytochrome c reductase cytochrome b subunit